MDWYGIVTMLLSAPVDCPSNVAGHICEESRFEGYKTLVLDLDETLVSQAELRADSCWRFLYLGPPPTPVFSWGVITPFWEPLASQIGGASPKMVRLQSPSITSCNILTISIDIYWYLLISIDIYWYLLISIDYSLASPAQSQVHSSFTEVTCDLVGVPQWDQSLIWWPDWSHQDPTLVGSIKSDLFSDLVVQYQGLPSHTSLIFLVFCICWRDMCNMQEAHVFDSRVVL